MIRMRKRLRLPLSALSAAVLVATVLVSVALSLFLRSGVASEQHALLRERTSVAGLVVGNLFDDYGRNLSALDAIAPPEIDSTGAFTAAARSLEGSDTTIAAVNPNGPNPTVVASAGSALPVGQELTGDAAALVAETVNATEYVTGLVHQGLTKRLVFALRSPSGLVLYEELNFDLSRPVVETGTTGNNPFSDLRGALYASSTAYPASLILADTAQLPVRGQTVREVINVGASHWVIVAASNGQLVGTITLYAPWGALGAGLLAGLLATAVIETLARRRRYALELVDQRTAALREAMEHQSRLEQTEREARQAAEAANQSKNEFLSRMSHELRTPLNAVLGFGQLLELDDLDESQRESVTQIVKGGRHLLGLINDVLDISRIEAGNLAMSVEPVSTADMLDEILTLMRPVAAARQVALIAADPGSNRDLHVMADHQRLKQVMLNLVSNAIKYNRPAGAVTVSVEPAGQRRLRIVVADTGPGISPDNLNRLFVPFERLGAERSDIEGTGVGLALSRRLAEAMGGTLQVQSTPGEGSRFWIELAEADSPLNDLDETKPPSSLIGQSDGIEIARHKVLYIEDNPPNLRLVERILARRDDIETIEAMQGGIGLALAQEHHPDLILLDLHLPDLPGDQVLQQLKSNPNTATTPVVILSADATPHQIERLLAAGAITYLTKPLDVQQLLSVVEQTLGSAPTPQTV